MPICDAHLDLAYNAVRGREVLLPALQQAGDEQGIPTVGLPDLIAGGVNMIAATIFCEPMQPGKPASGYANTEEAHTAAMRQLRWCQQQVAAGRMRFVKSPADIAAVDAATISMVLLLEGADPLRTPDDIGPFFDAGLRAVGLAWHRTRYAGGTGAPGPLTTDGVDLVKALDGFGIIHDASHLAEESFWQLMKLTSGPVMASHSNCRARVPTDRQLSDDMIRAIVDAGGVIGINFYDKFLLPPQDCGQRHATLADVIWHIRHICDIAGDCRHVGLGTDMDGGLGREQIPSEITTSADLPKVGAALAGAGFAAEEVAAIMGGNWADFFRKSLPV